MKIRKKIQKLFTFVMLVLVTFNSPATLLLLNAVDGEPRESVCIATDVSLCEENATLTNEGDIRVVKSVSPTDTLGRYKITFEIEGKPYTNAYPLYAVVVFDRSGSMICDPTNNATAHTVGWLETTHYTAADGTGIRCEYLLNIGAPNSLTKAKWENAISGAQSFNTTIKNALGSDAHVSLITFASDVSTATSSFTSASFGHPLGGTDLASAITTATTKLNNDTAEVPNAKKVILVISDGDPDSESDATTAANTAKNSTNNIEIYAIGYQTNATTSSYLRSISSYDSSNPDDKHYSNADPDTVSAAVEAIAHEILAAGTNASIEDTLTTEFSFTSDVFTGQTHSFTLNNINETKQTIEFYVDIDQTLPTGVYDTNNTTDNKAELTYTNPVTNQVIHLVFDESPTIEWIRPSYNYTVNYYKDNIGGELITSETGTGELYTLIPYDSNINIIGYSFDHIEGQETITNNSSNNVLNVIYTKNTNIEYNVIYHYEELTENGEVIVSEEIVPDTNNPYTGAFGDVISGDLLQNYINTGLSLRNGFEYDNRYVQTPATLYLTDNTLDIYYKRKDVEYTVKYFFDEVEDESLRYIGSGKLGSTVTYIDKVKPNYVLDRTTPENRQITIVANSEENIIEVYYKRIYTLKIAKEVKKFNEDTVLDPKDSFNFEIRFTKDNQNITGDYQYKLNGTLHSTPLTFTNGVANISLRSTDNIEILNLDKGITYTIIETAKEGYVVEVKDLTNEINASNVYSNSINDNNTVTFINTYGCRLTETGSSGGLIMTLIALFMFGAPILYKIYNFNLDRRYRLASK